MTNIIQHPGSISAVDMPPIDPDDQVCVNCAFSNFKTDAAVGDCRANPPTALMVANIKRGLQGPEMEQTIQSVFPPVERLTFCHAFEHVDGDGSQPLHD